ncbi:MAG: hypothetical protein GY861_23615 [bacterium]|nr:hypothetical protein [bacterium]
MKKIALVLVIIMLMTAVPVSADSGFKDALDTITGWFTGFATADTNSCQHLADEALAAYDAECGSTKYNLKFDINKDGVINYFDYNVASYMGGYGGNSDCQALMENEENPCDGTRSQVCQDFYDGFMEVYKTRCGNTRYNPSYDIDKDGKILLSDFIKLAGRLDNEEWCQNTVENTENPCEVGCEETDDGNDPFNAGILTKNNIEHEDKCRNSENLKEYYCTGDSYSYEYHTCIYGCSLNACTKKPQEGEAPDLSDFPDLFLEDGNFNGFIVIGQDAPSADTVASIDIATSIQYATGTSSSSGGSSGDSSSSAFDTLSLTGYAKLDTEIFSLDQNLISVGNPCDNSITKEISGETDCDFDLEEGQGIIKLYHYGDYHHLIVTGSSVMDTRMAARVLANYEEYAEQLYGTEVKVVGTSFQCISVSKKGAPAQCCEMQDGECVCETCEDEPDCGDGTVCPDGSIAECYVSGDTCVCEICSEDEPVCESYKIETPRNKVELNEPINSVMTSVSHIEMPEMLKTHTISNEHDTHRYRQVIYLPEAEVVFTKDSSDSADVHDDEVPTDYLKIPQSPKAAYEYKISFSPALKSDHNSDGDYLDDIRGKKITLMGKEFTIVRADHTAKNYISLALMSGALSDTLNEGQTKTYTLNGRAYEITVSYIGESDCKFTVRGEVTDPALEEGETYRTSDGTEIGVIKIIEHSAGGGRGVHFYFGADKIVLYDSATDNDLQGGSVTLSSEHASNLKVNIDADDSGTEDGADVFIEQIKIWYEPSEDLYVGKWESSADIADAVESQDGMFFMDNFEYVYEGLTSKESESIGFIPDGANNYKIYFYNKAGDEYREYLIAKSDTELGWGRWTGSGIRPIVTIEDQPVQDEEYFIVDKNGVTNMMQFKGITPGASTTDEEGTVKFKDIGSGENHEASYTGLEGFIGIEDNNFNFKLTADTSAAGVFVDMNGDGDLEDIQNKIHTENGAEITLEDDFTVSITMPEEEEQPTNTVSVQFGENSENEIDVEDVTGTATSGLNRIGSSYEYADLTYPYGAFVSWNKKSAGPEQDEIWIEIPETAATANVLVTSGCMQTEEECEHVVCRGWQVEKCAVNNEGECECWCEDEEDICPDEICPDGSIAECVYDNGGCVCVECEGPVCRDRSCPDGSTVECWSDGYGECECDECTFETIRAEIEINKGWNMVGLLPFLAYSSESTCNPEKFRAVFAYFPIENKYGRIKFDDGYSSRSGITEYEPRGYTEEDQELLNRYIHGNDVEHLVISIANSMWIYSDENCGIVSEYPGYNSDLFNLIELIREHEMKLVKGWTFLSVLPEMDGKTLDDIKGTCNFKAAFGFNSQGNRWENIMDYTFQSSEIGYGFIVSTSDECMLGYPTVAPPPLPTSSGTSKCELKQGLNCADHAVLSGDNKVALVVQNGMGSGVMINSATVTGTREMSDLRCHTTYRSDSWSGKVGKRITNGGRKTLELDCGNSLDLAQFTGKGNKEFNIEVQYYKDHLSKDYMHTMTGSLVTDVE